MVWEKAESAVEPTMKQRTHASTMTIKIAEHKRRNTRSMGCLLRLGRRIEVIESRWHPIVAVNACSSGPLAGDYRVENELTALLGGACFSAEGAPEEREMNIGIAVIFLRTEHP